MIRCLIVEDEPLARQVLARYIQQTAGLQLVYSCAHALEAFAFISQQQVDLLFLDIQLPQLTGIEFIRSLKQPPAFVLTTAYPEYAAESYDLEAIDYLVKPITYERFIRSIARFNKSQPPPVPLPTHTYFKVDGRLVKVEHASILYVQACKDYILLKTIADCYLTHMTMTHLLELLPSAMFQRVHRSYIVNTLHVASWGRNTIEIAHRHIPVGEKYRT